jgi:hypothetical protein
LLKGGIGIADKTGQRNKSMMKMIKTTACAIAMAVALALYDASARADVVTAYSTMTLSLTVKTNFQTSSSSSQKLQITSAKLVTKDVLNILGSAAFANTNWPAGAKIVVGWDVQWAGDVLVVDSTGTNVLYDATVGTSGNYLSLNIHYEQGTRSGTSSLTNPGSETYIWYNTGFFRFSNSTSPHTYLHGYGSCTENFSQKWDSGGNPTTWSDVEMYSQTESGQFLNGILGTTTGTITLNGHGAGSPWYLSSL